jgi:hypothetical protein
MHKLVRRHISTLSTPILTKSARYDPFNPLQYPSIPFNPADRLMYSVSVVALLQTSWRMQRAITIDIDESDRQGPDGHRDGSEQSAETCLADADRASDIGRLCDDGTHLLHRHEQDGGVAVAAAFLFVAAGIPGLLREDPALAHSASWG